MEAHTSHTAPPSPARLILHVVTPPAMLQRIDQLVGDLCLNRSEAARLLITAGLDAVEERRTGRPSPG